VLPAICALGFAFAAEASSGDLGLLTNYYRDCPASRGPHATELRRVVHRALSGDHSAMRLVIMHEGIFSTGDNEGYTDIPEALLRTLGDARYAEFITGQPRAVQQAALAVFPEQIPDFQRRFPQTAKLYHEGFSR
jgi:hypothetical protein